MFMLTVAACEAQVPVPPITWEGEHIAFGTDVVDVTPCGAHPRYEDEFFGMTAQALGEELPDELIEYYWLTPEWYTRTYCPSESQGCFNVRDGQVYTLFIPHQHELVHGVAYQLGVNSQAFLDEGLADLFDNLDPSRRIPKTEVSIHDGLSYAGDGRDFPPEFYGRAGHFMRFLLDEFGADAVMEVMRAVEHGESLADISTDFSRVLGFTLEEVDAMYRAYPECSSDVYRVPLMECASPPMERNQDVWYFYSMLYCDDADVIGPSYNGRVYTTRTFDVEAESEEYLIRVVGIFDSTKSVTIGRCEGGCESGYLKRYRADTQENIHLRPGRHHVTLYRDAAETMTFGVEIYPPGT